MIVVICKRVQKTSYSSITVMLTGQPCVMSSDLFICLVESDFRVRSEEHSARLDEVLQSIDETGTYELTVEELEFGAKIAWRNAPRCLNRIIWNTLHVCNKKFIDWYIEFLRLLQNVPVNYYVF